MRAHLLDALAKALAIRPILLAVLPLHFQHQVSARIHSDDEVRPVLPNHTVVYVQDFKP